MAVLQGAFFHLEMLSCTLNHYLVIILDLLIAVTWKNNFQKPEIAYVQAQSLD